MAFGTLVYRGHLICPSEHIDPGTGKHLYSISELKHPLTPPLLMTQNACKEYINAVKPYNLSERVDPYGMKRKNFTIRSRRQELRENKIRWLDAKYSSYET